MSTSAATPRAYAELAAFPHPGATITLPIGLRYFNEFYGTSHVTKREHVVTIVDVDRDEFYWKKPDGDTCFARWRRKLAERLSSVLEHGPDTATP